MYADNSIYYIYRVVFLLCCNNGGMTSPAAEPQNMSEMLVFVLSRMRSGYLTPLLKMHFLIPGSSVKFVS